MYRFLLFISLISFIACKTTQPMILDNPILNTVDKQQISSLYIPIKLGKKDLEKAINEKIGTVIFEEPNLNGDNISVRATRTDSITLDMRDSVIQYIVPLQIYVKKSVRFLGDAEAEGALQLQFETRYALKEDWSVQTQTTIQNHQWLKTPKINVLGASIPVGAIADRVLQSSKEKITAQIDNLVKDGLSLKGYVATAWNQLQQPMEVSKEYQTVAKITPYALAISPFKLIEDTIVSTLFAQGLSEVSVGSKSSFAENAPLPPLKVIDFQPETSQIRALVAIPFAEAEQVALNNIKGETYSFGKKSIKIEDLHLSKEGDKLAVEVEASGDYEGKLFFKGIPSYDTKNNRIDIEKVEFRLDTKNFLFKTAKWLLSDLIIHKMEGNLQYSIEEELNTIKTQIQKQFTNYEIQPGISVEGAVGDLKVIQVGIGDTALQAAIELSGKVQVIAKDF